jgi:MFS family permease
MLGCGSNAPALSCACFCECNSQQPRNKNGEVRDALLHQSDRGTPPDEATPDGNDSLYCFNFLTQRASFLSGAITQVNAIVYAALVEFITLPLAGWLSDIYGRKALYMTGAIASIAVAFPFFWLFETKNVAVITVTLIVTMTLTHALLCQWSAFGSLDCL